VWWFVSVLANTVTSAQVLVGAHALLANGGVMAGAGNQLTAMAAKHHAVPFVVLVGLQKLSPLFPHDPSVSFNDYKVSLLWPDPSRVVTAGPDKPAGHAGRTRDLLHIFFMQHSQVSCACAPL
jgi:translation initiation factor 2B subunit (eIF-2B alpha/beta/delta family)